ncbi:UbiX family flavin prenyltransferase, partial [Listeria valentina]|uniref:UbiX family flavin prenyltransferase n=1 Tax=Listeria valentina TaxID=2705293 RepID=UPI0014307B26
SYAIDLVKKMKQYPEIETHGIISSWAKENLKLEAEMNWHEFKTWFDFVYSANDLGATIASGSFLTEGMIIIPASMKTVASISTGLGDNLISRAADVILKEQRKLILVPRETPLSVIHLENLTKLARIGCHIIPPIPAFYHHPQTIQDLLDHHSMKVLDSMGVKNQTDRRWSGANE